MSKKFKVGIVGCGGIATQKHLPALSNLKNVEVVAFCDIIPERAKKLAKKFGTEDAIVTEDYKELCTNPDIDVIHVCTPNASHAPISILAMENGKDVMCEKPMAKTAEDARKMVEVAKETGRTLTVGYQGRQREDSLYLKQIVEDGDLGDIYFAKAHAIRRRGVPTWGVFLDAEQQGGGPLIDIGTHALDLTLWEMDNYDIDYVVGSSYRKLGDNENSANIFGPWDPKEFTVEDSAFGFIKMKNGATVILESSWALNTLDVGESQTTLAGTKAGADMKGEKGQLRINGEKNGKMWVMEPDLAVGGVAFFDGAKMKPEDREMWQFYKALEEGKEPTVLPEQALVVTEVLEAIYRSAESGKPIHFENGRAID